MRNIHDVINANDLAKRCITAIPGCENESLINAYKTKIAFEKYLKKGKPKLRLFFERFLGENDEYTAEKLFSFMYGKNKEIYKDERFEGDFSQKSLSEVFKNFLDNKNKIGDCLGLTQAFSYLLLSKGIEPKILSQDSHVLLGIEKKSKLIRLETTRKDGFNYYDGNEVEKWDYEKLESMIYFNIGCLIEKNDLENSLKLLNKSLELNPNDYGALINLGSISYNTNLKKALKFFNKAITINPNFIKGYNNREAVFFKMKEYQKALNDYNKEIELNPNCENAYNNLAITYLCLDQDKKALENLEKYASFSEENAKEVAVTINSLRERIKEKKNELTR